MPLQRTRLSFSAECTAACNGGAAALRCEERPLLRCVLCDARCCAALCAQVFGFDTFWVTSVENYQTDGVVFRGNMRGKDTQVRYAYAAECGCCWLRARTPRLGMNALPGVGQCEPQVRAQAGTPR
eukprot:352412-Chlamydomonas_euryale.AAC.3